MTEHEQGAEIAAAVGAAAGSTITRAEIVDDWLLALTFGDGSGQRVLVRTPWRLVNAEGLCLSSADDPERLRREASTLVGLSLAAVVVNPPASDSRWTFTGGWMLQTFTTRRDGVPWVWTAADATVHEAPGAS